MSRPAVTPREAAADWLERREQGPLSPHDEARLSAWLSADARHAAAYAEMSRVYAMTDEHAAAPEIRDLRQAALACRRPDRRPVWGAAAAAGLALAVGLAWSSGAGVGEPSLNPSPIARIAETLRASADPDSAVHRTRVGERLTLNLPDGSVATLNTDSVLKVAYQDGERGVGGGRGPGGVVVGH